MKKLILQNIFFATLFSAGLNAAVIDVYPGAASQIGDAVEKANPGDRIQLHSGTYAGTVKVQRSGLPDKPIVISGLDPVSGKKALLNGGAEPGRGKKNQGFMLNGADWISIQDMEMRNCWNEVVNIQDSSYVSIQRCDMMECGQTAVYTRGAKTHHILIEGCRWTQDVRIYTTWNWTNMHHEDLKYYNGGIYGGDGAGGAVIRGNEVGYVFNGMRWWLEADTADKAQYQANVEIYDNYFHHCRDNIIEPEIFCWNLHVYHNRMDSCPKGAFSIDGVKGGEIWVYANTGKYERDGAPEEKSYTLYKFTRYGEKPSLEFPYRIYHNSWSYGTAFVRGSRVTADDFVIHFNNAYVHSEGSQGLGLKEWPGQHCEFDYDISSVPWHPDVAKLGYQKHGIEAKDPGFISVKENLYQLNAGSPAIDGGKVIDGFTLWYEGKAPDMGAYEGKQKVYGMPFVYRQPPGGALYKERPRIVRIFSRGNRLALFFSTQLDAKTFGAASISIRSANEKISVQQVRFDDATHSEAATLVLEKPLSAEIKSLEIGFNTPPMSLEGETATLWASDLRVVRIPEKATLVGLVAKLFQ